MKSTFWTTLEKPFLVLAPMENVTDVVFRHMVVRMGKPDVFFTEFTSTDGLTSKGFAAVSRRLEFTPDEKPIVAQIWGNHPEKYFEVAKMLVEMGFDGIDINMGCPDKNIVRRGCCSGLIKNPSLAKEIIAATKEGAGDVPVSVKTRLGFKEFETESWLGLLLEQDIAVLTVHGRTVKELSKVPAHWDEIGKAVKLRDAMKKEILIVGNGDVVSRDDALEKVAQFGVDGIMIGRGIFQNPWIFNKERKLEEVTVNEKLALLIDHIELFTKTWGDKKPIDILKKFYKVYVAGVPDAHNFRLELMECKTPEETIAKIRAKMEF
jgi:nifR3 family TIM-barrel protein